MWKFHPKYVAPNAFTALSMLCGLSSVAASASGNYVLAAWLILWGVLLDKLDGTAARLLKASSEFGVQFDSFADFVVFGIAPAALCYFSLSGKPLYQGDGRVWLMLGVGFYVVATSARLARFNISSPPGGDKVFYGIPTTLIGALMATGYLTWAEYGLSESLLTPWPAYLVVAGLAMVSNVKLPKLKMRQRNVPFHLPVNAFQIGNIAAAYVLGFMKLAPGYLLFLVLLYLSVGVTWCLFHPPEEVLVGTDEQEQAA